MKLHLPQRLFQALLAVFVCSSVSEAAVAVPDGYTTVQINSAADFAAFTPEGSVNYAFVVADGVSLQGTQGTVLLPAGSVMVQGNGSLSFAGAGSETESHLFDGYSLIISADGAVDVSGYWSPKETYSAATVSNSTVIKANSFTLKGCLGEVRFRSNSADNRGVVTIGEYGRATLTDNASVSFENNELRSTNGISSYKDTSQGAAMHIGVGATLDVLGNTRVSFSGNTSTAMGGAIAGYSNYLDVDPFTTDRDKSNAVLNFSGNKHVVFSGNRAQDGGAIHGAVVNFTGNGEVLFSENVSQGSTSSAQGGALWVKDGATATFSGNDRVSFEGNTTEGHGGAVYMEGNTKSDVSQILQISDNEEVSFARNSSVGDGGAICARYRMVEISGNRNVEFTDNKSGTSAGAIYGSSLRIVSNDSVTFQGNYSETKKVGFGTEEGAIMRAIYIDGNVNTSHDSVELGANGGGHLTFYDAVYAIGLDQGVDFNREGKGDIIFSGKYAEENVRALSGGTATESQIKASLTSEFYEAVTVHGGRLCVEDGAVLQSWGMTVGGEGQSATLALSDGSIDLNMNSNWQRPWLPEYKMYDLAFGEGATLALEGANSINVGNLTVATNSTWTFTLSDRLGEGEALLNLSGSLQNGSSLTIQLQGVSSKAGQTVTLLSGVNAEEWSQVTWTGIDASQLQWDGNTLYAHLETVVSSDYWVNDGADIIYADGSDAAADQITQVILNGGTFTMEKNLNAGVAVRVDQNSTVKLEQGVTLNSASLTPNGGSVVLDGSGVYNLGGDANLKGSSFADTWQGEVAIGDSLALGNKVTVTDLDLGQYGKKGSSIVLRQLEGSLKNGMNVGADVTLEGEGEDAFALTTGVDGAAYEFAGAMKSASGANFVVDTGNRQNFTFSGDVSEWKGLFQVMQDAGVAGDQDAVTNVTFEAGADAASADIGTEIRAAQGSTMNLTIKNAQRDVNVTGVVSRKANPDWNQADGVMNVTVDTVGHTTSFRNTLEVDSLTVKDGSTVKVAAEGSEGVVVTAKEAGSDAVLTNVVVSQNALSRLEGSEGTASMQNVRVWLAGGEQAGLSNIELASSCVEVAAGATVKLTSLALDAKSSVIVGEGSSALLSGQNSLVATNVVSGGTGGVLTLETNQLAGVTLEAGADLTLGVMLAPRDGGVLEILLTDMECQALMSRAMTSEDSLLEAFRLELLPSGLSIAADKVETTAEGTKVSFTLVPEPTTATLGLLALGLLAARRRRK